MTNTQNCNRFRLEAIDRIGSIPLVENSFKRVENFYGKVKNNNRMFNWYFETAEATIFAAIESLQPAVKLFETPLKRLDNVMCKSLDILEQRIPLVYLPPEMMYWNTKEYMSDHLVRPVIKRADSVKQIGNAVLESPLTTYAADRIDGAFTVADKYVDKYLVPIKGEQDQSDAKNDDQNDSTNDCNEKGAIKAIHHGQRLSRKLKRRLTQRTLAEARALQKQGKEAIHILIYAAELIATDPKMAFQKARELWLYLSEDEPENQERPTTLEELLVLLARESARHVVHLTNFCTMVAANIPRTMIHSITEIIHHFVYYNNRLIKITKLKKVKDMTKEEAETVISRVITFYGNLQSLTSIYLERFAVFLSGRIEAEKVTTNPMISPSTSRIRVQSQQNNSPTTHNNINGVY